LLFRRDLIAKIRLEFELWCSLVDAFAPSPFNTDKESLCVNFNDFPQHVTPSHYQQCAESRQKMQKDMLGFVPNKKTLQEALFKSSENSNQQVMDRSVVDSFNKLSSAMGKLYEDVYMVSDRILQQREMVRSHLENIVAQCGDAFPPGTRVMIFGSSANGFGSPSSDLDMCLQIPPNTKLPGGDEDPTGALAMGKLAEALENSGMKNVDTVRLTARIPIIMFNCPRPMGQEGESELMECDLSFLNSLAVLNTSLLLSYSRIHPVTRVLASLIKRWAKARDINNPSKHTLSSYGYIIMLLHFLTYHRRKGNGLIASMETERTSNNPVTFGPLLPNLQRMDPAWLATPVGQHPYAELERLPQQLMKHPLEEKMVVNTYFHRIKNQQELTELQTRFPSQDLSLAIMLASFFRYYAFEFDYKRHVVSMNSTIKRGMVEREIKAETHAWKVYSTGLAIEDPFETFYDIAHVVKGGNFHRLRNELALAYTKIINAVESGSIEGMDLIDLICEPIEKEDEAA
jgi:DNA polymerase sigma